MNEKTSKGKLQRGELLTLIGGSLFLVSVVKANVLGVNPTEYWLFSIFIAGLIIGVVGLAIERKRKSAKNPKEGNPNESKSCDNRCKFPENE
jgi:hypothetical protein